MKNSEALLTAITKAQINALFDLENNFESVMKDLLATTIELLDASFGFIGELKIINGLLLPINSNCLADVPKLEIQAISIASHSLSKFNNNLLEFRQHTPIQNMENLFGKIVLDKKEIIVNYEEDSHKEEVERLLQLPKGHPLVINFLGIPFVKDNECIGSKCSLKNDQLTGCSACRCK
jgi:hypothetical protein